MTHRIIHHVYNEHNGEVEGMFDAATGEMLATWCCNDASWRNEYFDGFMDALGVKIIEPPTTRLRNKYVKVLREHWKDC